MAGRARRRGCSLPGESIGPTFAAAHPLESDRISNLFARGAFEESACGLSAQSSHVVPENRSERPDSRRAAVQLYGCRRDGGWDYYHIDLWNWREDRHW
jgi:hypothetical protein